jgi:hypothetical protein
MENNVQDLEGADLGPMSKDHCKKVWLVVGMIVAAIALAVIIREVL